MIDPRNLKTGDFVEADTNIHDYATPGTVFKIIDRHVPGQTTSALGWLLDLKTGLVSGNQAYPLPHDKISPLPRRKLADVIRTCMIPIETQMRSLEQDLNVLRQRIRTVESTDTREDEELSVLRNCFSFI